MPADSTYTLILFNLKYILECIQYCYHRIPIIYLLCYVHLYITISIDYSAV